MSENDIYVVNNIYVLYCSLILSEKIDYLVLMKSWKVIDKVERKK